MIDLNDRFTIGSVKNEKKLKEKGTIHYILKGVGISFIATITLLLILSIILTYTSVSESICNIGTIVITGVSILIGSSISNANIGKKGIINGGILGGIYILILYLLSSIVTGDFSIGVNSFTMIIVGIICGVLGGIFGVNIKNKK